MNIINRWAIALAVLVFVGHQAWGQATTDSTAVRKIGAVTALSGNTITLKADSVPDVSVLVQDSTRIVQLPPGQTDLKAATPIQLKDVQIGDRMLVRGKPGSDAQSVLASSLIVMKQADVAQKQQHDREDWQKRGVGGIVSAIDPAGTITVSVTPTFSVAVKTSKDTRYLRYAANSISFEDAKHGTFEQIKTGDQLRARGDRAAGGKEITAEEVVSGSFRNIAGTISSVDSSAATLSVKDLLTKKTVIVKVTAESQLKKLPPQMAQGLAMMAKGGGSRPSAPSSSTPSAPVAQVQGASAPAGGAPAGGRPGGPPDLQRMLSRAPAVTLAELQKGDALMIVATEGSEGSEVTAITLLSGVEPILTASPSGSAAATLLSGCNVSGAPGDAGPQ